MRDVFRQSNVECDSHALIAYFVGDANAMIFKNKSRDWRAFRILLNFGFIRLKIAAPQITNQIDGWSVVTNG